MLKSIKKFNNLFGISSWFGSGAAAQEAEKPGIVVAAPEKATKTKKAKKVRQLTFQEEAYILTLISTENQTELAPAIKPIFDQGKEFEIIANLEVFIKARETEIEKICQQNFAVRTTIYMKTRNLSLLMGHPSPEIEKRRSRKEEGSFLKNHP